MTRQTRDPQTIPATSNGAFAETGQFSAKARFGTEKGFSSPRQTEAGAGDVAFSSYPVPECKGGFAMKREELMKRVDGALADLETDLSQGTSETLQQYLRFLSNFHNYSFRNVLLIVMQHPEASMVAGYQKWKQLGRQVRKGEKGIRILAPLKFKKQRDEETEKKPENAEAASERYIGGFRAVSVFDISQTDGEEIPQFSHTYSGDPAENLDRLKRFVTEKEITLVMEDPEGGALGISEHGTIRIKPDLSPADTFAVLAHEVAHELLHKGERREETTKTIRETEAEAVAFAVCAAVGLEAGSASSDYIQLYQGDVALLRKSLEFIRATASEILAALEGAAESVAA